MYFDWRLWRLTKGLRGRMALVVALGLLATLIGIFRFVLLGTLLARVLGGAPVRALLLPAAGVAVAIVLRAALDYSRTMVAHRNAAVVQETLRAQLFAKIVALGPAWFATQRSGGVVLSVIDGVEQLQTFFGQYLPQLAIAALTPIVIFAVIAWWDVPVALVMLGFALLCLMLPWAFYRWDRAASSARQRAFKSFGAEFLDAVQGLATLKAFGQSGAFGQALAERARTLSSTTMWLSSTGLMTRGIIDTGVAVGAAAALALGIYRVSVGEMSLQALLIVLMAGTEIFRPLRDFRTVLHSGMQGQAAAAGIAELVDATPTLAAASGGAALPADLAPTIAFRDIRFAYAGGRGAALDGLDFEVAAGERIGIVGPSGAGKSTIAALLLRLHDPQSGSVRIGGQDLRSLDADALRSRIAVVQQDTYLFHGTVAENLRFGKENATPAELEAASRAANAHEFIMALPAGYGTVIGERGARLSGGQRQRLAIARALLRDAPILILDEALSSVDAENEAVIQKALDRLMAGRTTLILAHRLSSVIAADRILVVEGGRVVESGTHADLIRGDGPYRRLMGAQAGEHTVDALRGAILRDGGAAAEEMAEGPHAEEEEAADSILRVDQLPWRATIAGLVRFIAPWRWRLAVTTLSGIGRVSAFIAVGVCSALAVAALKTGASPLVPLLLLALAAPLSGLLHWCEAWLAHDMAYRLLAEMRIRLYAKLDALAPAYLLRRRSGDLVGLATQDVETIEYFFAHTVTPALVAILIPSAVLVLLAVLAWPTALVLAPFLLFVGIMPVLVRRRIDRLGAVAREAVGRLNAHVVETIQGLAELVVFQAASRRGADFLTHVRAYHATRIALFRDLALQAAELDVATGLGGLGVALVAAMAAQGGGLAPTLVPLLTLLSVSAFLPVSEIANVSRQLADTFASAHRLEAVYAEKVPVTDGPAEPAPPATAGSAIRLEQVSFTYPSRRRPALDAVSLDIAPGSTVALVGPSGSGKTTLANLLLRFWDPAQGRISLDGVALPDYRLDHLRRRIALVAQDTYLFNDTLRANIALARPDADDRDIETAIARAALGPFVAGLPDGWSTRVGERGVQLSGGQRQRVAIARAFLKNAPVLILDEATSHLDALSEAQIRQALTALMRERTTIVIAHRLSTVRDADVIAVLDGGKLIESGSHAALLAQGGLYAELVERQLGLGRAAE